MDLLAWAWLGLFEYLPFAGTLAGWPSVVSLTFLVVSYLLTQVTDAHICVFPIAAGVPRGLTEV